jgi:hypothetical protein
MIGYTETLARRSSLSFRFGFEPVAQLNLTGPSSLHGLAAHVVRL